MAHGIRGRGDLEPLLARATVIVIGPGLGQQAWGEQLLQCVYDFAIDNGTRLVVDADALNILAERRVIPEPCHAQWVLTPHPGEAARLLACRNADVQRDRFAAATELQRRFGGATVLKGSGSLVATAAGIGVASYGNPGMASGGMGDVLSGVLGALLAQGLSVDDAARLGVCLHGAAGDLAATEGQRGMLATDLLPHLRNLVNGFGAAVGEDVRDE
jgi:NAD(P)H-hydrate epimerase